MILKCSLPYTPNVHGVEWDLFPNSNRAHTILTILHTDHFKWSFEGMYVH